jgi:hypothetical protein
MLKVILGNPMLSQVLYYLVSPEKIENRPGCIPCPAIVPDPETSRQLCSAAGQPGPIEHWSGCGNHLSGA